MLWPRWWVLIDGFVLRWALWQVTCDLTSHYFIFQTTLTAEVTSCLVFSPWLQIYFHVCPSKWHIHTRHYHCQSVTNVTSWLRVTLWWPVTKASFFMVLIKDLTHVPTLLGENPCIHFPPLPPDPSYPSSLLLPYDPACPSFPPLSFPPSSRVPQ